MSFPARIHLEPTTRCNLACAMCVKQARGCSIAEQDMDPALVSSLAPALAHARGLVFGGIGEPLLHPHLDGMARTVRAHLPAGASIGVQTNGTLLTAGRAVRLAEAGVNRVCVSVDGMACDGQGHGGAPEIVRVLAALRQAREHAPHGLEIGVEFVLMRGNSAELPRVLALVAEHGADFALVSHMLPYDREHEPLSLFNPNTDRSREIFAQWKREAAARGLDLADYHRVLWKYEKTGQEKALVDFVRQGVADAAAQGVFMHLARLLQWDAPDAEEVEAVLERARETAEAAGLRLDAPPPGARWERRCDFVEDRSVFIAADGEVSPCHFLWHDYTCRMDGGDKAVRRLSFGNLLRAPLETIWNSRPFADFRDQVLEYDYPHCSNCTMAPCSDILAQAGEFERDCYGIEAPCGHCHWCTGGLRCLS